MTGPFEELTEAGSCQQHGAVVMSLHIAASPTGLLVYEAEKCSQEAKEPVNEGF